MSEIRNQLKSQSIDSLLPTSIEAVGGRIFPDSTSLDGQLDFSQIIQLWQSVHSPSPTQEHTQKAPLIRSK